MIKRGWQVRIGPKAPDLSERGPEEFETRDSQFHFVLSLRRGTVLRLDLAGANGGNPQIDDDGGQ